MNPVVGETLSIEASELILKQLMAEGTRSKVSLRKSIVKAKDKTLTSPGMTTVVGAVNRHYPVTENTKPVIDELIKMAQEVKSTLVK